MPRPTPKVAFVGETLARDDADVWADGSLSVSQAVLFSGIGRTTLYELMGDGTLAWGQPTRYRLIARRSLVAYLARHRRG